MQKKIKINNKEKKIKNHRSSSINYESKIPINKSIKPILKTNLNTSDFESNPIESTITSESTTTTETAKRIYIYRKNISKSKNSIGVIRQNSKKQIKIKPLTHCTSTGNLNKNKKITNRFNTLETCEYKDIPKKDNGINNDYFQNNEKTNIKINDTTPNRKYYKFNNYTINSGPNIFKKGINLNKNFFYNQSINTGIEKIIKKNEVINIEDLLLLEERFNDIIYSINNKSNIANECFELINFYNQSSLYNKFENYFKDFLSKKIVHSSILLTIFDIILVYHISFDDSFFKTCYDFLLNVIKMNHQSYLLYVIIFQIKFLLVKKKIFG